VTASVRLPLNSAPCLRVEARPASSVNSGAPRADPRPVRAHPRDPRPVMMVDEGGMATEDLLVADLNGDKRPDIIASGRATRNVKIYWNDGPPARSQR